MNKSTISEQNNFALSVKERLQSIINDVGRSAWIYTRNPFTDFTRNRKLPFADVVNLVISMEKSSLNSELLEYFNYDLDAIPTVSALVQQRDKILPDAFDFIFHEFNESYPIDNLYKGYHLLAVDGSEIRIAHNPSDKSTYCQKQDDEQGYNRLSLNALYDLCSKRYIDASIFPFRHNNERREFWKMVDRYQITDPSKTIIVADRGYSAYNTYAHLKNAGLYFVIREKTPNCDSTLLSSYDLPEGDQFDITIKRYLTYKRRKSMQARPTEYHHLSSEVPFDYLGGDNPDIYYCELRVVKFPISEDSFEYIVTNLPRYAFSVEEIKELYHMRWGIETSFRELKHTLGISDLHSKKIAHVQQEIFSKLILYNFCEIITTHVVRKNEQTLASRTKGRKHNYQVNFTLAIIICKKLFRLAAEHTPPDIEGLILRYILPVRANRSSPRRIIPSPPPSFNYR